MNAMLKQIYNTWLFPVLCGFAAGAVSFVTTTQP